ncbi:TPA: acyltransferase family protein [Citrobacter sedlakii]|nr:acyltransferase family protein [Citrobacter sedlakii]
MIGWISFIRFVAIIFVVLLHSSAFYFNNFQVGSYGWLIGDIGNAFTRWAVPVFVMISGALLLGREYNLKDFYARRLIKILIPLIAWSIFYTVISFYQSKGELTIQEALKNFASGRPFYHMWFLYMMLGLYAITPIINVVVQGSSKKELKYIIVIMFLLSIINITDRYINNKDEAIWLFWFLQYIPYFISGYYFSKCTNHNRFILLTLISLSIIATIFFSNVFALQNKTQFFFEPLSPFIIVYSLSLFVLVKNTTLYLNRDISDLSLGVYLIHPFFLLVFFKLFKVFSVNHPLMGLVTSWIVCSAMSFLAVFIISRIKHIKRIV